MNNIKEAIRHVNIGLSRNDHQQIITFVTLNSEIAQQTLIANLSIMYGKTGEETVIIDTDFENNSFSSVFRLNSKVGLSDFLNDYDVDESNIIQSIKGQNMAVITSGSDTNQTDRYQTGDPRFRKLVSNLAKKFDHIFINTPKFQNNDEFQNLFSESDGVIIISDIKKTKKRDMYHLVDKLKNSDGTILGYISVER